MADAPLITTVHTDDAHPDVAPYKVARSVAKGTADVTVSGPVGVTLRFWSLRLGGGTPIQGKRLRSQGGLCGVTRCGQGRCLAIPPSAPDNRAKPPVQHLVQADWDDGGGDGDRTIRKYGAT